MKRKLSLLVLLCALVFVLTGCMQTVFKISVHEDMSGTVEMQLGILEEFSSYLEGEDDPFADLRSQAESQGFTASNYTQDGYTGVIVTAEVDNVTTSSGTMEMFSSDFSLTEETDADGKKVIILQGNLGDLTGSLEDEAGMSIDSIAEAGKIDMRFILELPYPAVETNATSQSDDGKTLTWDLLQVKEDMYARAVETQGTSPLLWIIIGVVAAAIIIAIIIIAVRSSKKKKAQASNEPVSPFSNISPQPNAAPESGNAVPPTGPVNPVPEQTSASASSPETAQAGEQANADAISQAEAPLSYDHAVQPDMHPKEAAPSEEVAQTDVLSGETEVSPTAQADAPAEDAEPLEEAAPQPVEDSNTPASPAPEETPIPEEEDEKRD